jgi:PAS domain S-box-containing protein
MFFAIAGLPVRPEPLQADAALEVFHPDDRDRLRAAGRQAVRDCGADVEVRIVRPEGDIRRVLIRITPVRDDAGEPARLVGVVVDLTRMDELEGSRLESEARYRALAQATGQIIWIGHPDGSAKDISSNWETITGHSRDVVFSGRFSELVHPDDTSWLLPMTLQAVGDRKPFEAEFRFQHANGHYLRLRSRNVPVYDDAGTVHERIGTFSDVTSIRESEARKAASDRRFSDTFHTSRMPMLIRRVEDFRLLDVNDAFLALAKRTRDDVIGIRIEHAPWFTDPDYAPGFIQTFMIEGRVKQRRTSVHRSDGRDVPVTVWGEPIDVAGERCVLISFEDISHQLAAEDARRASEELFYKAFHAGPVPQAIRDAETLRLTEVNQAWVDFTGYSREEVIGKTPMDLPIYAGSQEWIEDAVAVFRRDGGFRNLELNFHTKNGEPVSVLVSADQIGVGGRPHVLISQLDITDRKRAALRQAQINAELEQRVVDRTADLEAANRELEAFSYSVSHDLRTPLRHVTGFIDLLARTLGPSMTAEVRELVDDISDSATKMGMLIDDLLEFARVSRMGLEKTRIDLADIIGGVIAELKHDHPDRAIEWAVEPMPVVPVDPNLMRMALFNLGANAVKYTRPRAVATIEFGVQPNAPEGQVVVYIRDNGVGFDMKYVHKLFGVFQRLHSPAAFEGTGIGLANVQRIVHRHGGRVWAESEIDRGATFYMALPAEP